MGDSTGMDPETASPTVLKPHVKDLGSFTVHRLLPGYPNKMVGPFIFFDHIGPASLPAGTGLEVRPHPHIGLATITYLFEGTVVHRDSLGTIQRITPGDLNWMTAGRGIVHSERSTPEDQLTGSSIHGIQTWLALPKDFEEVEPAFTHISKRSLPELTWPGVHMRLLAGSAFGERAPTPSYGALFYLTAVLDAGSTLVLPPEHEQRGIYLISGQVRVAGSRLEQNHMVVLPHGATVRLEADTAARVIIVGGEKADGDRFLWWNFVSSSRELMENAKQRWLERRFPPVPEETGFIPLPPD